MAALKEAFAHYLDLPVESNNVPVLVVVEALLGVANGYMFCSDRGLLPTIDVCSIHSDDTIILQSGTNIAGRTADYLTEWVEPTKLPDDGSDLTPLDRATLHTIIKLAQDMLDRAPLK